MGRVKRSVLFSHASFAFVTDLMRRGEEADLREEDDEHQCLQAPAATLCRRT